MMEPAIDSVDASVFTVPTDAPEADGTIAWDSTTMVLVRISSGGTTGMGWTYGAPACGQVVSDVLAPIITGRSALDIGGCWEAMVKAVRNNARQGAIGYAISAVDIALWDLKARLLELPLHKLLGAVRDKVPVYGSGGFTTYTPQQLEDQLGGWAHEQHIPRVKIKIGESWGTEPERDLARMRQARHVIGEDVELFVDANGGYTRKQAIRVMEATNNLDVHWFEEPVSSDDLAGCGGITEWLRAAAVAASHGLEVSGHCGPHLHAHVAAATPNLRHLEWFHDHVRIETMFFDGTLNPQGGTITPDSSAPGNGLTLRSSDIEEFRVR